MQMPRGTLVLDVGSTNTKLVLFDGAGRPLRERRIESRHVPGPPYQSLDPEPALALLAETLPDFDAAAPVDVIVPCAHGSALALLDEAGRLALPVMDYFAEPPAAIAAQYREIAPPFSEVFCPANPMALTLGLQLFWQQTAFAQDFARVRTILPWGQYFAWRMSGRAVSGNTELGAQTQLVDVASGGFSSLARGRGWDRLFAPPARPYDTVGTLKPEFRRAPLAGRLEIKAGIHDSNANYLRYLAAGLGDFTLLSTGTWIIIFDTRSDIRSLDPGRDTATNTDLFSRPVACSRFMGGLEIASIEAGAPAGSGTAEALSELIRRGTFALPSFSNSGGPMPGRRAGQDRRPAAAKCCRARGTWRALLRAHGRPVACRRRLAKRHHHRWTVRPERALRCCPGDASRAATPAAVGPARRHGGRCGTACPHLRRGRHAEPQHRSDAGRTASARPACSTIAATWLAQAKPAG